MDKKSEWENLTEQDKRLLREFFDLLHTIDQRENVIAKNDDFEAKPTE